jgi:hypothetical protein
MEWTRLTLWHQPHSRALFPSLRSFVLAIARARKPSSGFVDSVGKIPIMRKKHDLA